MARKFENLESWLSKDRKAKEEFIKKKSLSSPDMVVISFDQPDVLRQRNFCIATLTTKEFVLINKEYYDKFRQNFRADRYQENHRNDVQIQVKVSTKIKDKLEDIKTKCGFSNYSQTVSHLIQDFTFQDFHLKGKLTELRDQLKKHRDYETSLNKTIAEQNKKIIAYEKTFKMLAKDIEKYELALKEDDEANNFVKSASSILNQLVTHQRKITESSQLNQETEMSVHIAEEKNISQTFPRASAYARGPSTNQISTSSDTNNHEEQSNKEPQIIKKTSYEESRANTHINKQKISNPIQLYQPSNSLNTSFGLRKVPVNETLEDRVGKILRDLKPRDDTNR